MTPDAPPVIYFAPPKDMVTIVRLDTLDAIFDRRSGLTHLVAEPIPAILEALGEGPADTETLIARLGEDYDIAGEEAALAARLDELAALGLVEIRHNVDAA